MPQFVKADMRQTVLVQQSGEMVAHVVRRKGTAIRPFEHVGVLLVVLTAKAAVLLFCVQRCKKYLPCFGQQRERTVTAGVLGLVLGDSRCHLGYGMADGQRTAFKVDTVPLKPSSSLRRKPYKAVIFTSG